MIFYLVPAAAGRPAMLQPTQADANREAKERDLKVRAPAMEHNIPTDKAGLMAYVNDLLARDPLAVKPMTIEEIKNSNTPEAQQAYRELRDRPLNPDVGDDDDGFPRRRAAFTSVQIETNQLGKRSDHVQDLCYHVSKLSGTDLGLVALEVSARLGKIGEDRVNG